MRRWLWRIAILLVVLVAIFAVALHFLMRSDLLRRMACVALASILESIRDDSIHPYLPTVMPLLLDSLAPGNNLNLST